MLFVSTDSFFIRWSETDGWTINFWVSVFSLILYAGVGVATKEPRPTTAYRQAGWPLLAVAIGAAVSQIAFVEAITRTSVANVVVIVAATPIVAALVGKVFLGESTSRRVWTAIAITFSGVLIIVARSVGEPTLDGDLLAVGAVTAFAINVNLWRRFPTMSRVNGLALASLLVMVVAAGAGPTFALDGRALVAVIGMGLLCNPTGRLLYSNAPRYAPAGEVAMFAPVETVAASLWAWVGFSEVPAPWTVVGGLIVIAGMLYGTRGRTVVPHREAPG